MKNGVCRGAKPFCRESEGFFLARKKVRGMVERLFSTLLERRVAQSRNNQRHELARLRDIVEQIADAASSIVNQNTMLTIP